MRRSRDEEVIIIHEEDVPKKKVKRLPQKTRSIWKSLIYGVLLACIWGWLVYAGYHFTKQYFDTTINNLQQTNALNMQAINERLASINSEINAIKEAISQTDQTLSSSGSIQAELNKKIELLDKQLQDLEKSLEILKEAP